MQTTRSIDQQTRIGMVWRQLARTWQQNKWIFWSEHRIVWFEVARWVAEWKDSVVISISWTRWYGFRGIRCQSRKEISESSQQPRTYSYEANSENIRYVTSWSRRDNNRGSTYSRDHARNYNCIFRRRKSTYTISRKSTYTITRKGTYTITRKSTYTITRKSTCTITRKSTCATTRSRSWRSTTGTDNENNFINSSDYSCNDFSDYNNIFGEGTYWANWKRSWRRFTIYTYASSYSTYDRMRDVVNIRRYCWTATITPGEA